MAEIIEIEVVNWKKFNGRSDCDASWLRLENRLFESDDMYRMDGAEIAVWIYILCQASKKKNGRFKLDFEIAVGRIKVTENIIRSAMKKLNESGILQIHGRPRTSADVDVTSPDVDVLSYAGDERNERTNETNGIGESDDSLPPPGLIWNETAEGRPKVTKWTKARAAKAKTFFSKNSESDWRKACCKVSASEFLSGRSGKWANGATFDWLLNETNFTKVLEGNYDDQPETNKPRPDTFFEMASRVLDGIKKFGPDSSDQLRIFLGEETFSIALRVGISRIRQMPAGEFTHKRLAGMLKDVCFVPAAKMNSPPG